MRPPVVAGSDSPAPAVETTAGSEPAAAAASGNQISSNKLSLA